METFYWFVGSAIIGVLGGIHRLPVYETMLWSGLWICLLSYIELRTR